VAGGEADERVVVVALAGHAGLGLRAEALVVLLEHEVHDAGDGIGTVDRRCAARDDVDALEQVRWNRIRVDRQCTVGTCDMASAIDEHQRALLAEATQIEEVDAGSADEARRVGARESAAQRRQVIQRVADRRDTRGQQLLGRQLGDWSRRLDVAVRDARAGDDNLFHVFGRGVLRGVLSMDDDSLRQEQRGRDRPCEPASIESHHE
jgi:hypothetical protein